MWIWITSVTLERPVNDRLFDNEHLASVYAKTDAIAKTMDANGYNTFWLAEHHFQPEGYECIPNVLMSALHLTHITERLNIGCGFNIAPMWHPLRLAEDYATADILTGGRVIFGVGRGYHSREIETFGSPLFDQGGNRDLFEEQVDIIFKAFNEASFSHHGKNYTIPPERAVPRLPAGGNFAGAASAAPAGRVLAADTERDTARAGLHGEARHEGHHRRRRCRGRCDAPCCGGVPGRIRAQGRGPWSLART